VIDVTFSARQIRTNANPIDPSLRPFLQPVGSLYTRADRIAIYALESGT